MLPRPIRIDEVATSGWANLVEFVHPREHPRLEHGSEGPLGGGIGRFVVRWVPLQLAANPRGHPPSRTDRAFYSPSFGKRRRSIVATGTIKKVVADRGFGFIAAEDKKEYFFHRGGLDSSLDFDRLVGGEKVEFEVTQSPKGPRAEHVRAG
jgi:CspA family cold shock protein